MADGTFATAVNCMDGRTQEPVSTFLRDTYGVDYVDEITEPGPNKILAEATNEAAVASIRQRVEISVLEHGSKQVAVVGHHDCAGNPAEASVQRTHTLAAIETVRSWELDVTVFGLWVDENWDVSVVS